ncbi:MAG: DUF839 domain-containing protein [Verrucomicrobiales bacterium]|nr:DUF839 domain-containing protein [Verrucomicrobiales bacterium]
MKSQLTIALGAALAAAPALQAGTDTWFTPLTQSAPVVAPNALEELSAPWVTPAGIQQINWVSLAEVENTVLSPGQSIVRVPGMGTSASMFDMLATNPHGTHLFIPHETPVGAGVSRYDIYANKTEVLFKGDTGGLSNNWANDWGAFDPCRWTPHGTLFLAEEWAGRGRVIEVLNPMADLSVESIQIRELDRIPNVSHEGINFSNKFKNTIYFIDEWNSGSIYKMVLSDRKDFTAPAQVFVLSVDAFLSTGGVPANNYNEGPNATATREGAATWVPLTDKLGAPLPGITDPFRNGPTNDPRTNSDTMGGRPAADDAGGTPYGRPEDMTVSRLANGNEVLYIAVTSENKVLSVEILNTNKGVHKAGQAMVRTLCSNTGTPKNVGFAPTTGTLTAPDNVAIDALGNVYVIEDNPNNSSVGGDIWFARDVDNDGVAESLDHFLSLRVNGCESTGMIFNPAVPTEFHVCVMHPTSTDLSVVPNGFGDAVWTFNLANIPNQDFVRSLKRGRLRTLTNQ